MRLKNTGCVFELGSPAKGVVCRCLFHVFVTEAGCCDLAARCVLCCVLSTQMLSCPHMVGESIESVGRSGA